MWTRVRMWPLLSALAVTTTALAAALAPPARAAKPAAARRVKQAPLTTAILRIEGMHCEGCALFVREGLEKVPGVKSARIDLKAKQGVVRYDAKSCQPQQLIAAVKKAGYTVTLSE